MTSELLKSFIAECRILVEGHSDAGECAQNLAPLMLSLLLSADEVLQPEHLKADPAGYRRTPIIESDDGLLSLSAVIWTPGFWSDIHDHQSWGLMGIHFGILEEQEYISSELSSGQLEYIDLAPRSMRMYGEGSVFTHLPADSHIHRLGVPEEREPVACLHLIGPDLTDRYVYDLQDRSRRLV